MKLWKESLILLFKPLAMIEGIQVKSYVATVVADSRKCLKWNLPLVFQSPAARPQWNWGILFREWKWEWRWGGAAGHPGGFAETERGTGGRIWFLAFTDSLPWWWCDCTGANWLRASVLPRLVTHTQRWNHCCVQIPVAVWASSAKHPWATPDICFPSLKDQEQSPEPSDSRGARGHHRAAGAAPPAAARKIRAAGAGGRGARKAWGRFSAAERHCPGDKSSQRAAKSKQGAASQAIAK